MVKILISSPNTDFYNAIVLWHGSTGTQCCCDRCTSRCDHFSWCFCKTQLQTVCLCNISCSRHRDRQCAMLAPYISLTFCKWGNNDFFDAQIIQAYCCTDNINNRVDRPNFVEMYLVDWKTMGL